MPSSDSTNPYDPSISGTSVPLADEIATRISWRTHLVLLASAFVSWATMILGIALDMRNMFGGPPPDNAGTVLFGLSILTGVGGICYFVMSRSRRLEATQSGIQNFALVLLLLANALPPGQIAVGILSYAGGGY